MTLTFLLQAIYHVEQALWVARRRVEAEAARRRALTYVR